MASLARSWSAARQRALRGVAGLLAIGFLVGFMTVQLRSQRVFLQILPGLAWPAVLGAEALVAAGLVIVLFERGQRMNGVLLVVFGICYFLNWMAPEFESTRVAILLVLSSNVPWVLLMVVLLRYPEPRLARQHERVIMAAALAWLAAWQVLSLVTWRPTWATREQAAQWPVWWEERDLHETAGDALYLGNLAFGALAVVMLGLRVMRTKGLDRRTYGPVRVASAAAVVAALVNVVVVDTRADASATSRVLAQVEMSAVLLVALALLFGTAQRSLARVRVADLVLDVNAARTPEGVQTALRRTLADPALTVWFWSPDSGGYVDVQGRRSPTAVPEDHRLALPVTDRNGGRLALVLAEHSAAHHGDLVASALAASALGLENAALHANLLARLAEVRESRARVVAAGDAERRRLERDLHDGAQQHLVGIALKLRLARDAVTSESTEAVALLDGLRTDVHDAVEALRALAHGIYPPLLASGGLRAALTAAAARAGLPTDVAIAGDDRYPPEVEATVYFCCLEALQNAGKHAGPEAFATLRVWEVDGALRFDVVDDGAGFDPGAAGEPVGHGFVNMRDRLSAVGGSLEVHAGADEGVRVGGVIPLTGRLGGGTAVEL